MTVWVCNLTASQLHPNRILDSSHLHPDRILITKCSELHSCLALQVRIEAMRTVKKLAHMGGHEMVLQMVAWQDPQAIAIKAFYEPDLHVNFCAKLATDPVVQVVPCPLCTAQMCSQSCCILLI